MAECFDFSSTSLMLNALLRSRIVGDTPRHTDIARDLTIGKTPVRWLSRFQCMVRLADDAFAPSLLEAGSLLRASER